MLKHLIYNVPRGYKVGYGALFTKIFQESGVELSNEPIIVPRDENLFGKHSLALFKLRIEGGKIVDNVVVESSDDVTISDDMVSEKVAKKDEKKDAKKAADRVDKKVAESSGEKGAETVAKKDVGTSARKERAKKRAHTPLQKEERSVKRRFVRVKKGDSSVKQAKKTEKSSSKEETEETPAQEQPSAAKEQPSADMSWFPTTY